MPWARAVAMPPSESTMNNGTPSDFSTLATQRATTSGRTLPSCDGRSKKNGGFWGFGGRDIAVPAEAMVLLGQQLEVLDFTPQALGAFPTFQAGSGTVLGPNEVIHMGLAHPSH